MDNEENPKICVFLCKTGKITNIIRVIRLVSAICLRYFVRIKLFRPRKNA